MLQTSSSGGLSTFLDDLYVCNLFAHRALLRAGDTKDMTRAVRVILILSCRQFHTHLPFILPTHPHTLTFALAFFVSNGYLCTKTALLVIPWLCTRQIQRDVVATIITTLLILVLAGTELLWHRTVDVKYDYKVDSDLKRPMFLTLDLTVAMSCDHIGGDYIDVAGNSTDMATQYLKMDPANFELAPNQAEWAHQVAEVKAREGAHGLDSLQRFLHGGIRQEMPDATPPLTAPKTGCRVHGQMPINKVSANFHITAGKSIHHAQGHSHLIGMVPEASMNFSHRIDRLSFSKTHTESHTLDGEVQLTENNMEMFQYHLMVVPTSTQNLEQSEPFESNQYSVAEQRRKIDNIVGGNGLPGIYVKYDFEPISVHITEVRRPMMQFFVRMCGIVGGVFATSGMLHQVVTTLGEGFSSSGSALPRASTDSPIKS